MHLTALVDSVDHVCCRYRLAAFRPWLEQAGHTLELRPLPHGWWARWWLFQRLRGACVILQRRLLPGWQLALLRRRARLLLFDFDDAIFLRDSYSTKGMHHPGRLRRFAATVRACDAISAGNSFLAEQAQQWLPAPRCHVIPTCVDPDRYRPKGVFPKSGEPGASATGVSLAPVADAPGSPIFGVELVWVGSSSTLQGLEAIRPLLEDVGREVPGSRLKLICDRFFALRNLPVVECPWTAAGEAAEMARADVGISWIPDDLWSRGKCGLKVLQYMAAGLPVVTNPVGVHIDMVRHGETGFLARTPAEWVAAIRRLAQDPELRRRMGQAGRRRLENEYSVAAGAARWINLLNRWQTPQELSA